MRLEEPTWWYGEKPSPYRPILRPIGSAYGWVAAQRIERSKGWRSQLPVICVGNFTVGGTGKTPLSLRIAEMLSGFGEQPAFLTRGYGGRLNGPKRVDHDVDTADDVGDEALLLARRAPAMIACDRRLGARALEALAPRPTAIIMDDGLQNPALVKDLVIAVVDAQRGLGNGEVFPAGPLRAPLELQLRLTDAIVINQPPVAVAGEAGPRWTEWLRQHFKGPVLMAQAKPAGDTGWLLGARLTAFAGIANPARFFAMLDSLGAHVADAIAFPDHHRFGADDASRLIETAARTGTTLVTTEKDLVRLPGSGGLLAELRARTRVVAMELAFEDREARRLESLLRPLPRRASH